MRKIIKKYLQFLNQHDTMSKQFFEKDNYPFS